MRDFLMWATIAMLTVAMFGLLANGLSMGCQGVL